MGIITRIRAALIGEPEPLADELLTRYPEQLPPALPASVRHERYVPFSAILPRCAAIVHHGGIGTCAQALAAGIPQLVSPFGFDQPDNAVRSPAHVEKVFGLCALVSSRPAATVPG